MFFLQRRLGLDANYPPSILSQSRVGVILAPIVHGLEMATGSSKASPLEMLEEDLNNEMNASSDVLSKQTINTIASTAAAPLGQIQIKTETDIEKPPIRCNSSGKNGREQGGSANKEKSRSIASSLTRSISSLTLLGCKKSSDDTTKPMPRGRSISISNLSEVVI